MITVFNRKELYTTFDMKEQARVRDILADNKIEYSTKTINRMSASALSADSRGRVGTLGNDMSAMYEYIIYVRKVDYEKATHLIGK